MSNGSTQFPRVWVTPLAKKKLEAYYRNAKHNEISGLGRAWADQGEIIVDDVMLFEQESTPGDTEIDPEQLSKWLVELIQADQDPSLWRLWWHKHPIQGWSSIDDKNIEGMNNHNWLLSIVHTPTGWRARLDTYEPFRVTMDSLEIRELVTPDYAFEKAIKEEVEAKVKPKKYQTQTIGQFRGGGVFKDGVWVPYADEKKGTATGTSANNAEQPALLTETSADTRDDDYWARMTDQNWQDRYDWVGV